MTANIVNATFVVKISYGNQLRRGVCPTVSYAALCELVSKLFAFENNVSLILKYKDDEEDLITLSSDEELYEALRVNYNTSESIRLFVEINKLAPAPALVPTAYPEPIVFPFARIGRHFPCRRQPCTPQPQHKVAGAVANVKGVPSVPPRLALRGRRCWRAQHPLPLNFQRQVRGDRFPTFLLAWKGPCHGALGLHRVGLAHVHPAAPFSHLCHYRRHHGHHIGPITRRRIAPLATLQHPHASHHHCRHQHRFGPIVIRPIGHDAQQPRLHIGPIGIPMHQAGPQAVGHHCHRHSASASASASAEATHAHRFGQRPHTIGRSEECTQKTWKRESCSQLKERRMVIRQAIKEMKANSRPLADIQSVSVGLKQESHGFKTFGGVPFFKTPKFCPAKDNLHEQLKARLEVNLTIPDNSELAANTPATKTWRLKNMGTTAWPAGCHLLAVGRCHGDLLNGPQKVSVASVKPGQVAEVSIPFITPSQPGRYVAFYRMATAEGVRFGQRIHASFVVRAAHN